MPDMSSMDAGIRQLTPKQLRAAVANFLPKSGSEAERISTIEAGLRSLAGQSLRDAMAEWIVDEIVPVKRLVPEAYENWRAPVREAMMFVVAHLSPARLAPKVLEQLELPKRTSAEARLLRLIAKVPGLQKLGQVIARNQHLRPALRDALARLENGIRDVKAEEIREIIQRDMSGEDRVRMWGAREADPALCAKCDAEGRTILEVPRNRVPLYCQRATAGTRIDRIVSNLKVEGTVSFAAQLKSLPREALNKAARPLAARKPGRPHLNRHPL
jgi:hypothetical protein